MAKTLKAYWDAYRANVDWDTQIINQYKKIYNLDIVQDDVELAQDLIEDYIHGLFRWAVNFPDGMTFEEGVEIVKEIVFQQRGLCGFIWSIKQIPAITDLNNGKTYGQATGQPFSGLGGNAATDRKIFSEQIGFNNLTTIKEQLKLNNSQDTAYIDVIRSELRTCIDCWGLMEVDSAS